MATRNAPNGPYVLQANQHSAEAFRQVLGSLVSAQGVVGVGDLAVSQHAAGNMSVDVASGFVFIAGTQSSPTQGAYHCYNDATVNLAVTAADPTNPRHDLVVASVQDAAYAGGANQWVLQVITGTPAPSPVDPAVPANTVTLARLQVNANATGILTANITDLRVHAILRNQAGNYKARMHLAASTALAASQIVPYDTVDFDPASSCTTGASAKYTAPVAGFYQVNAAIWGNAGWTGCAKLDINGADVLAGSQASGAGATLASTISDVVQLNAGDTVQLKPSNTVTTATGITQTYLSIHLLSPKV